MIPLAIGARAVPFSLIGVDDRTHSLADYAEKPVLVVIFSCNHCPYVRAWEDRMVALQAEYAARGVQFLVINANDPAKYPEDDFPSMKRRAAEKGFNFPYLYDETQEIARAYGATRTPEVFVFDSERLLRYHGAIDDNHENPQAVTRHYLREALDAVLSGTQPAAAQTPPVGCTIKWRS
jgi:peroxiredoxin